MSVKVANVFIREVVLPIPLPVSNCPEVSLENDKVRIDDDYGNHVLLDHGQANLLKEALILVRAKG